MVSREMKMSFNKADAIFRQNDGICRTSEAIKLGVHPRILYAMRDAGAVEPIARGVFRRAGLPPLGQPDMVAVGLQVPRGIMCLISALAIHELTTQIPHEVHLALEHGTRRPQIKHPPVRIFWYTGEAFTAGVERRNIDGIQIRVYGPEKTVADCFKHRNKIGLDVAVEALKACRRKKRVTVDKLMYFARICRVDKIMRPYLEAML